MKQNRDTTSHVGQLVVNLAVEERLLVASQGRLETLFHESANYKLLEKDTIL
jgi:hypothetical protein